MACYHPLRVATDEDGRLDFSVINPSDSFNGTVLVPCRYCIGCLAGQARDWSIRCYHEAMTHTTHFRDPDSGVSAIVPNNVMITLTYDDDHLPANGLLQHSDFQNFMKRLRRARSRDESPRYFMAGEYGGQTQRPHYHSLLFGETFGDRYSIESQDKTLSCSYELDEMWGKGTSTIDDVTFGTVRYVTGYLTKKTNVNGNFTGPLADFLSDATGELCIKALSAEYRQMSRRPGLGRAWLEVNIDRIYPTDEIEINGQKYPPPGYYDRYLRTHYPGLYREVQDSRLDRRIQSQIEWTPNRCGSAEEIHSQRLREDRL